MSESGKRVPILSVLYERYLDEQNTADFIAQVSTHYTPGTLQRLAEADDSRVRRAAILGLGFIGDYEVNHTMGRALHDGDRTVRMLAENGIRHIWMRAGSGQDHRELEEIIRLNTARHFDEAIEKATELISRSPWFAEAWNQRAIAHFNRGNYVESIRDCHQSLEINPYHFAAASGMGQAYLQLGNPVSSLECFRRALRLNPNLEGVRAQIDRLSRLTEDRNK